MSNGKHETIADIVYEMRNECHAGDESFIEWLGEKLRHYPDRIEAAHKRDRESEAEAAQIREMLDSKIKEIESMKDAPLDGCFEHQETNGNKLCAKLDFYEFAKRILRGNAVKDEK